MQFGFSVQQAESAEKSEQPECMVAMYMRNENTVYFAKTDSVPPELDLCTLTAVHQKKPLMYINNMSGGESFGSGNS